MLDYFNSMFAQYTGSQLFWLIFGLGAQAMFFMRFFIQWIESERRKESYIPVAFWYFSLFGGLGLFIYAFQRQDLVIMFGQSVGLIIYSRNLYLIWAKSRRVKQGL